MNTAAHLNEASELKKMVAFSNKADLRSKTHAGIVLDYVTGKEMFTSRYAPAYLERLQQLKEGITGQVPCIICRSNEATNGIFCPTCMSAIDGDYKERKPAAPPIRKRPTSPASESPSVGYGSIAPADKNSIYDTPVSTRKEQTSVPEPPSGFERTPAAPSMLDAPAERAAFHDTTVSYDTEPIPSSDNNPPAGTEPAAPSPIRPIDPAPARKFPVSFRMATLILLLIAISAGGVFLIFGQSRNRRLQNDVEAIRSANAGSATSLARDTGDLLSLLMVHRDSLSDMLGELTESSFEHKGTVLYTPAGYEGLLLGIDPDSDMTEYIELSSGIDPAYSIAGVRPGDNVHSAADALLNAGAVEDVSAEQYWAEVFLRDGQPNMYLICFEYLPAEGRVATIMATVDKDTVVSVSAEEK